MQLIVRASLLLLGLVGCATPSRAPTEAEGKALALALPILDGPKLDIGSARGKVVLVDLWATWCKPCEASFPFYAELYAKHQAEGFVVWAVSVDKDDEEVRQFLRRRSVPFQILRDPDGTFAEQLDVKAMPTALIVGRDGTVRWTHAGFEDDDRAEIEAQVLKALGS